MGGEKEKGREAFVFCGIQLSLNVACNLVLYIHGRGEREGEGGPLSSVESSYL